MTAAQAPARVLSFSLLSFPSPPPCGMLPVSPVITNNLETTTNQAELNAYHQSIPTLGKIWQGILAVLLRGVGFCVPD